MSLYIYFISFLSSSYPSLSPPPSPLLLFASFPSSPSSSSLSLPFPSSLLFPSLSSYAIFFVC